MSDNRAIGVFDSGLGGLCAVRAIHSLMPDEGVVYFGDTGRLPYGTRSNEKIVSFANGDIRFLMSRDVKIILAACGTVSSVALDRLSPCGVRVFGVVKPAVAAAVSSTATGRVGIIGTDATVMSRAFDIELAKYGIEAVSAACPLLVSLIENGFCATHPDIVTTVLRAYLSSFDDSGIDTLILGCTHFPIAEHLIRGIMPGMTLIDTTYEAVKQLKGVLTDNNMCGNAGKTEYFVSDSAIGFENKAAVFSAGEPIKAVQINIEDY